MEETGGQLPSTADAFIQMAYDLFDAGQEASEHELTFLEAPWPGVRGRDPQEQAVSISVRAFSQVGAQPMLLAVPLKHVNVRALTSERRCFKAGTPLQSILERCSA